MRSETAAAICFLCACVRPPALRPVPAVALSDDPDAAFRAEQGVEARLETDAWRGIPGVLPGVVPVLLSIENSSGRSLVVRYGSFALVTCDGTRVAALPPVEVPAGTGGTGSSVPLEPEFGYDDYAVAPPVGPLYPGMGVWIGPFVFDSGYYSTNFGAWPAELPTQDVVSRGIPEGVIRPGGRISGFLYFNGLPADADTVAFRFELLDAETGERFGMLEVPLEVRR